jgi:hypothetical protein
MNCSLCNATIPADSTRCPGCGVEFTLANDVTVSSFYTSLGGKGLRKSLAG